MPFEHFKKELITGERKVAYLCRDRFVEYYSYRKAMVCGGVKIERDLMRAVEIDFAKRLGVMRDNHVTYVVWENCPAGWAFVNAFMFSDSGCYVTDDCEQTHLKDW